MTDSYREPSSSGSRGPDQPPPRVSADSRTGERLIALLLGGIIAWTYPVLFLIGTDARILGIPLLYLYLYLSWGLFVGLVALIIEWKSVSRLPLPQNEQKTEG